MNKEREGCNEPNCRRCLEISRITNKKDRQTAQWCHDSWESTRRSVDARMRELNEASEYRIFTSNAEDPFLLRRTKTDADFTASVNPREKTSTICRVVDCMVLLVVGIILGMTAMYFLLP